MALARGRRAHRGFDYWPGFVDALSTMLLVMIFLLSVFMLAQFFLSREVSGKDDALSRLNKQIAELTNLLALERSANADAHINLTNLNATLESSQRERARLQGMLDGAGKQAKDDVRDDRMAALPDHAVAQIEILNQQINALRRQLAGLEDALAASEARDRDSQLRLADLGQRLNLALAQKVQELSRYRSDFFGRLRMILGNRRDVRIVGDRFVFDAEVLFDTGQAGLSAQGQNQLLGLAGAVVDLEHIIPPEIAWVLRIDGHTDKRPIQSSQFKSNWDLSTARAIAVVQFLIAHGVAPRHLVAAGFGEFQPVDEGDNEDAWRRNRRIELKLTER
jgi:chemotaxis protein MotB